MTPRVLHLVESLDRGATENWLVRMLEHGHATGVPMDWTFYCYLPTHGELEDRARLIGARVLTSPVALGRYGAFARALRKEVAQGSYDVLHAHHDLLSGLYLGAVALLPLRRRIVHVHNSGGAQYTHSRPKQLLYEFALRQACLSLADRIVGVSNHALDTFLGGKPRRPDRDLVLYSGVPVPKSTEPFLDRTEFRRELGLYPDSLILLFAGRLVQEKNPLFVVDVLSELRKLEPRAVAVFAGAGTLDQDLVKYAAAIGQAENVRLLGWRGDVLDVMRCADWFILPSQEKIMEGFGLAVVEAQLAGLRLLISRGIAHDPLLPTASYRRLPISGPPQAWATAATELLADTPPSPSAAFKALAASPMDMDRALANLLALHA